MTPRGQRGSINVASLMLGEIHAMITEKVLADDLDSNIIDSEVVTKTGLGSARLGSRASSARLSRLSQPQIWLVDQISSGLRPSTVTWRLSRTTH